MTLKQADYSRGHLAYSVIGVFSLLAIVAALALSQHLASRFHHSVETHGQWRQWLDQFVTLAEIASVINTAGNDAFADTDLKAQQAIYEEAFMQFDRLLDESMAATSQIEDPSIRTVVFHCLEEVRSAMAEVDTQAHAIFDQYAQGDLDEAGRHMAAFDRGHAAVSQEIVNLELQVRARIEAQMHAAEESIFNAKRVQVAITAAILILVIGLSFHGWRLIRVMRAVANEQDKNLILSQIVKRTTNIVVLTDTYGRVEWVNEGFSRVTGYELDEVFGQKLGALLQFDKTDPKTIEAIREAVAAARPYSGRILNRAKDGQEYWLDLEITPRLDTDGQHIGFMAIENDITSLVEAQQAANTALRESQHLQTALDEHTLISITDPHGKIIDANAGFCHISGYTREELLGHDHRMINSGVHPKSFWVDMWKTIAAGKAWRGEVCNRAKDGSLYWVDSTNIAQRDEDGKIARYISLRIDITAKKIAQERLDLAMKTANLGLWDWDIPSGNTFFSDTYYILLGCQPGEFPMTFDTWKSLVHPDDVDEALLAIQRQLEDVVQVYSNELRMRKKDGSWVWIHTIGEVVERHQDGSPKRMIGVHMDISAKKQAESALQEKEERYALAVRGSRDGIWDWDLQTNKVYYASRWMELLGESDDKIGDSPDEWFQRITSSSLSAFHQELTAHIAGKTQTLDIEVEMRHSDGDTRWMLCRAAAIRDDTGKAIRLAGSMADITELKRTQEELQRMAQHDRLTGLPNRSVLTARIEHTIARAKRNPEHQFALLFFDFDRFKFVNDSLGHNIGDALLKSIAQRFRKHIRETDIATRFGGDEFVVLLDEIKDLDEAKQASERLLEIFAKPHHIQGHEIVSTASIGVVSSELGYETADDMVRDADSAMYHAKSSGKARYQIFDAAMHADAMESLTLEQELRRHPFDREFELLYQPVVSLDRGDVAGFEALVRWNHPQRGVISPHQFINIAEETGIIVPMGTWILRTACAQIARWRAQLGEARPFFVNVNVSKRQLVQPDLLATLRQAMDDMNVKPSDLKLEVTETAITDDRHNMIAVMNAIREMGVHLAMDDFGTGHSSLSCLHRFPIDVLKIDRSFIVNMEHRREFAAVVQSIIALAQNLHMEVVAEGIEHEGQLVQLQAMGCGYAQGYLFAKPLTMQRATEYLFSTDGLARSA